MAPFHMSDTCAHRSIHSRATLPYTVFRSIVVQLLQLIGTNFKLRPVFLSENACSTVEKAFRPLSCSLETRQKTAMATKMP